MLTIIEEGEFNYENLKKSKLDVEDVLGMAREKDIFDVEDIAYALFETTGKLSILPKSPKRPTVIEDFDIQEEPASLTDYVIVNGKLQYEVVRELGMNVETLFDRLKIRSKKDLENFLVVSYDKEKKDFLVHRR